MPTSLAPRIALCVLTYTLTLSANAQADSPSAADPPAASAGGAVAPEEGALAEIVVTAQKRSQTILDIPISISAINGAALNDGHIAGVEDLSRTVPGLSFSAGGSGFGAGEGNTTIEMRGVSSATGTATVGLYLNDAPITTDMIFGAGAFVPSFFDIQRVEVLRGPQGTLYGASSEGGTIRFVMTEPDLNTVSGKASVDVSNTKHGGTNTEESGVVNLPVKEGVLAIRLGGDYAYTSGWIDNYSLTGQLANKGVNATTSKAVRLAAKYVMNDDLTIKAEVFAQRFSSDDSPVFYLQDSQYAASNPYLAPPTLPTDGLYRQHAEVQQSSRDTMILPSLTLEANLGFATLTSVTSGFKREFLRVGDGTFFDSYLLAEILAPTSTPAQQTQLYSKLALLPSPVYQPVTYRNVSQEIRLASPTGDGDQQPIKWVAGVFFQNQRGDGSLDTPINNLSSTFQSIFGYGINSAQSPIGVPSIPNLYQPNPEYGDSPYSAYFSSDIKQYSGFGQVDADFASNWHAAFGLRYVDVTSSFETHESGFFSLAQPAYENISERNNEVTPKWSLKYDLTPNSNIYASISKGFRPGSHFTPLPTGTGNNCQQDYDNLKLVDPKNDYGPDSVWSYEIGSKSLLIDKTLSINASLFLLNWKDIQQTLVFPICGATWVFNAGDARIDGVEYELQYKPRLFSGLTLGLNGSATHTEITRSIAPETIAVGQNIPFVPDLLANVSGEYARPMSATVNAFVESDYAYTGESKGTFITTSPAYRDPAYGSLGVSTGVDIGSWRIALYGKNVLDNKTIIQSPVVNLLVTGYALQPRTLGLRVSGTF